MRNLNQNVKDNKRSSTEVLEGDTGGVDGHESKDESIKRQDYETIIEKMQQEKQDEDKIGIVRLLIEELKAKKLQNPPNLRIINYRKLKENSAKVNEVLNYFQAINLRELIDLKRQEQM